MGNLGLDLNPGAAFPSSEKAQEAEKPPETNGLDHPEEPLPLFRDVPKGRRKPQELFPLVDVDDFGVPTWSVEPTRVHKGMLDRHLAKLRAELAARKPNGSAGGDQ